MAWLIAISCLLLAAVQFKTSGTVLFGPTSNVAMDPDCCCGGVACVECNASTSPTSWQVEFDGVVQDFCSSSCAPFNSTTYECNERFANCIWLDTITSLCAIQEIGVTIAPTNTVIFAQNSSTTPRHEFNTTGLGTPRNCNTTLSAVPHSLGVPTDTGGGCDWSGATATATPVGPYV